MSYCRPAEEVDLLAYGWIPSELVKVYKDLTLEEFVLAVRNGSISSFLYNEEYSEGEKMQLVDSVTDVYDTLVINGFIRPEVMNLGSPEFYFTVHYIVKLGLAMERIEKFMPYFMSNEDYEEYNFCYERIEAVVAVLGKYLNEEEFYAVSLDVMSMGNELYDAKILKRAKQKLVDYEEELIPELEVAFAILS